MGNEVNYVQTVNVLTVEEVNGLAFLLVENGDQYIGASDFLLAGRLDTEHRPLQYTLKAQRRLGITIRITFRQQGGGIFNKLA